MIYDKNEHAAAAEWEAICELSEHQESMRCKLIDHAERLKDIGFVAHDTDASCAALAEIWMLCQSEITNAEKIADIRSTIYKLIYTWAQAEAEFETERRR